MSPERTCSSCGATLPDDAPEGALCPACTQAAGAQTRIMRAAVLETIGDYEVVDKLGQGGMGTVYRARQVSLGRLVALKVLPNQFGEDPEFIGRFQREAKVAASLHHANLVRVFAAGQADGCHYIAMELIEGENLHQRMRREKLPIPEALRICADVARGLQCGWDRAQLVHRDIKPSNVYLSHGGEVKVGDLGLAKSLTGNTTGLTQSGTMMGTPHYMSPEQIRGDKALDFRADVYSLGCTLYELLTGQPPYPGSDPISIAHQHINAPLPAIMRVLPGCPIPLVRLVGRMLKKNPRERHGTYEDLIAEMDWVREQIESGATATTPGRPTAQARNEPGTATAPTPTPRRAPAPATTAPVKSSPPWLWIGVAAGVLVLGIVAFLVTRPAKDPKRRASGAPSPAVASSTPRDPAIAWRDGLAAWRSVPALPEHITKSGSGIRLSGGRAGATFKGFFTDVAIRATGWAEPSAKNWFIAARVKPGQGDSYIARLFRHGKGELAIVAAGKSTSHPFPLPPGFSLDAPHTLELRAVGDLVTVFFDGKEVVSQRDSINKSGVLYVLGDAGTHFEKIDYADLTNPAPAQAEPFVPATPAPGGETVARTPDEAGFRSLFDGRTLEGWQSWKAQAEALPPGVRVESGAIESSMKAVLMSKDEFDDFELRLEWKPDAKGNGGILFRTPASIGTQDMPTGGKECQLIYGGYNGSPATRAGALFNLVPALKDFTGAADQWHTATLIARGGQCEHWIDGELYCRYDIASADFQTALSNSKQNAEAVRTPRGPIGLQFWEGAVAYRNIRIRSLGADAPTDPPPPPRSGGGANADPAPEPWQDALRDPAKLVLSGGVERTPEGLRFGGKGTARLQIEQRPPRDGALRIKANYGGLRVQLRARETEAGLYQLLINQVSKEIILGRADKAMQTVTDLRRFPVPASLQPAQDYELELRAVGPTLTVKLNGAVVGTATDGALSAGAFSVGTIESTGAPTLVKSFEVLDLDAPGGASAPPAAPTDGWVSLLPLIDPRRDAVIGEWKLVNGELLAGGDNFARLALPYAPPDEYNFRVRFTRNSGNIAVSQHLVRAGREVMWLMGGFGNTVWGFEHIGGVSGAAHPTALKAGLENGRRYESISKVRRNGVQVEVDGKKVAVHQTDWSDLTINALWSFPDPKKLGVGCQQPTTFHSIDILPVSAGALGASAAPATPTKDAPFVNSLGMKFVPVPITGGPTGGKRVLFSVWETRVQDYVAFAKDTQRVWMDAADLPKGKAVSQGPDHPAAWVRRDDAQAFCAWLTERERKAGSIGADQRYRLPTDYEWSCAVGIGDRQDPAKPTTHRGTDAGTPWSSWPPPTGAGNLAGEERTGTPMAGYRDGFITTAPVGSFPASPLGLFDLMGNVQEWVEDDLAPGEAIQRGGSYFSRTPASLDMAGRFHPTAGRRAEESGFRIVLAPAP